GFGEVLVLLADRLGRRHELDLGRAAERGENASGQIQEAAGLAAADVEQPGNLGLLAEPQQHGDAIVDMDEVAQLPTVGVVGAVRLEEPRRLAAPDLLEEMPGDGSLSAL